MVAKTGRGCRSCLSVAVVLVLCFLNAASFSLRGPNREVGEGELRGGATVTEVRMGRILLNGKELASQTRSTFAAGTRSNGLLHTDLHQGKTCLKFKFSRLDLIFMPC